MRKATVIAVLTLLLVLGATSYTVASDVLVRVYFDNIEHIQKVVSQFDDVASWGGKRYADIVVPSERMAELNQLAPNNETLIADVAKYAEAMETQGTGTLGMGTYYHTYEEAKAEMDSAALAHPGIALVQSIGTSLEGRFIWAIKISDNVNVTENEPRVLYVGNHHAREIITVEIPLYIMHYLTDNYGTNPRVTNLVDNREIWIVPTANPDGREYQQNYNSNWRKNRRNNGDGTYGVDLNRNYGYMWGYDDEGSSPITSSETYRGTGPFSEPEIQAVRNLCNAQNFATCISFHSYGNQMLYAWGYIPAVTPDNDLFNALGDSMSAFNGYQQGPAATTIYITNGDSDDWMYGEQTSKAKCYSYTFEVGAQFLPPTSQILTLCQQNLEPSLLAADFADDLARILPPATPILAAMGDDDDGDFTVSWDPNADPANPPVAYALMERTGESRVTDNAEGGDINFVRDGFSVKTTRYHSATQSFYSGKTNNRDARLSARIGLYVGTGDTLYFWCWYDIETDWDYGYVEMSTDGGAHFNSIPGNITTNYNPYGTNLGNGITGNSGGWVRGAFPLGAYANSTVMLRFRYKTDAATLGEGFYVDDIYPLDAFASSTILSSSITETHYDLTRPVGTYYYEVKAKDDDGQWGYWSQRQSVTCTGAGVPGGVDARVGLRFSNPVHAGGKVVLSAPASAAGRIFIFDVAGRLIKSLDAASGQAAWDLTGRDGRPASAGIYFVQWAGAENGAISKLVVLK
jgi:hypothetical protein